MAENKKSFLLYCDIIHTVRKLTDDQAGKLLKHILSYVNDENPTMDDLIIDLVFEPIKQSLKRDLKRYENICNRNQINGAKGGRPIKEPKKPSGLIGNPKEPKKPDIDSDIDIDNKKGIELKFEIFRSQYPGTKRGFEIEYKNFIAKSKNGDIELLLPALNKEKIHKQKLIEFKQFCPEWKNLSTWINQRCWTQEFGKVVGKETEENLPIRTQW
jgi:hypothetical protein